MTSTSALPVVASKPAMLEPIATGPQVLGAINRTRALIKDALQEGIDYGRIPGTQKNTLLKPGAEKIAAAFGTVATYDIVESEIDHDRAVAFYKGNDKKTSIGLYRYVTRCTLALRDGTVVGTGLATCSTMEAKYVSRPRDSENTALKMSNKRALVAAVLGTFGLSEAFTQDVGDDEDDEDVRVSERAVAPPPRPTNLAQQEADALGVQIKDCLARLNQHTEDEQLNYVQTALHGVESEAIDTPLKKRRVLAAILAKDVAMNERDKPKQAALIPDDTDKRGGNL